MLRKRGEDAEMKIINVYKKQKARLGVVGALSFVFRSTIHKLLIPIYRLVIYSLYKVDNNKITFFSSPDFSDNAKVLYEYLNKRGSNYSYRWIVEEDNYKDTENTKYIVGKTKKNSGFTLEVLREIATSKYVFFTHSSPVYEFGARNGQVVVNLWHGCGYKNRTSKIPWISMNPFDYVLVPGEIFVKTKSRFFGCRKEQVLPIGYPRYDLLFAESNSTHDFVMLLKGNSLKFIIWMPTYRKTESGNFGVERIQGYYDLPILKSQDELLLLNEVCRTNGITLCIKRHPHQVRYSCESLELSNICFISNETLVAKEIDLYNMLQYTDGLITDYSSIAIDYILLNKPIAFALNDYNNYHDAQGFVFENPLEYMPGDHLYSYDDMIAYLIKIRDGIDSSKNQREKIFGEVHNPCENYCKRICDQFGL